MRSAFVTLLALCITSPSRAAEVCTVAVDATESTRQVLHVAIRLPVKPGPLSLHYPKWIPGKHRPAGPVFNVTGLKLQVGEKAVAWKRDEVDFHTFHCTVPDGAKELAVQFDYLIGQPGQAGEPLANSTRLLVLDWHALLLYPKEASPMTRLWQPSIRLPEAWKAGSALTTTSEKDGRIAYEPVTLETLIDSPVLTGRFTREVVLSEGEPRHALFLACDGPEGLELSPKAETALRNLVVQSKALFGNRPYRRYTWLLALTDLASPSGLEHHESSDNRLPERILRQPDGMILLGHLLAHEMIHAWCGKYRRPSDMIVNDFQTPHRTRLLWAYEGLTDYLAWVLAGRAGFYTPEQGRDLLADTAERMRAARGRTWRPLEDTALASALASQSAAGWTGWRRGTDYYLEGVLIWLDADSLIRDASKGKASLDDFCQKFFAGSEGKPSVSGFTSDDLVKALNEISPQDWKAFFERRVSIPTDDAPLEGITRSGWKVAYTDKPPKTPNFYSSAFKETNLTASLGLKLSPDGKVTDVVRGKSADRAGVVPGMKILAVNGRRYNVDQMTDAVAASLQSGKVVLISENGDRFEQHALEYAGGLRYPVLERMSERAEGLEAILKAR